MSSHVSGVGVLVNLYSHHFPKVRIYPSVLALALQNATKFVFVLLADIMQLFVTDYQKQGTMVTIADLEILSQLRKVLRTKIGDIFWVQSPTPSSSSIRYEVQLQQRNDKMMQCTILSEQSHEANTASSTMLVAMPNKWEKAELIVQKLSEIGISQIVFWPSERSVLRQRNDKKAQRMHKIIKEAVEQSRGWNMPQLIFARDIAPYITGAQVIIFDQSETSADRIITDKPLVGVIGPEG